MNAKGPQVPASLEAALRHAAWQFARRERVRAWLYFGMTTLLLFMLGTVVLTALGSISDSTRLALILCMAFLETCAAVYWFIYKLRRKISLAQLALYIDHAHPELENRIVSAVEFSGLEASKAAAREAGSPWLIQRFLEDTEHATRATPIGHVVNERTLVWTGRFAAALLVGAVAIILVFNSLWLPDLRVAFHRRTSPATQATPFTVEPGNAEIRRGENALILVKMEQPGTSVALAWAGADGKQQTAPMTAAADAKVWHYDFSNVQEDFTYRVQVDRTQSETFTISTWLPPKTEAIHLTYTYPDYLRKPVEEARNSGPITAVAGTNAGVEIEVNKKLASATLALDSGERIPLTETSEARWSGNLLVASNDRYKIELVDTDGHTSEYQPAYDIKALQDEPPQVSISFPRGDDEVTALEEIPFEFAVKDDFGLDSYGIQYEVAGREPVRIALSQPAAEGSPPLLEAKGAHLLMLEEMGLSTGDLVTWTVYAKDAKPDREAFLELGDPFFMEVRPFRRTFKEAVSNAGAGQGQGQQQESSDQKKILIATWNLRKTYKGLEEKEFIEKRDSIVKAQEALMEERQAQGAALPTDLLEPTEPSPEGGAPPSERELQQRLAEVQQRIVDTLKSATLPEPGEKLSEGMESQQEAYSLAKKLEPEERSVQMASNRSQGGGGGSGQREINELEMDRNQSFYEEEQSPQEAAEQQASEEVLSGLEELAKRQQIANEEMAKLISELQQAKTEAEREELKRRLERLEEEMRNNVEQLDQLAGEMAAGEMNREQSRGAQEQLSGARTAMNRSLENLREERLQEARASGSRAANALDQLQQDLSKLSRGAAGERLANLTEQMNDLEKRQQELVSDIEQLKEEAAKQNLDLLVEQERRQQELVAEKEALAQKMEEVMKEGSQLAEGTQESQELLSKKLNDWLRETSGRGLSDKMRRTAPLVKLGVWDPLIDAEEKLAQEMREAGDALRGLSDFQTGDDVESLRMALREIQDVLQGKAGDEQGEAAQPGSPSQAGETAGERSSEEQEQSAPQENPAGQQGAQESTEQEQQASAQSPAGQQGQEGEPSGGQPPNQPGSQAGTPQASRQAGGGGANGGYDRNNIDDFVAEDYGRWLDAVRNAESLLPEGAADGGGADDVSARQRLEAVRQTIGGMRREYRTHGVKPQYEAFLDQVVNPLIEAAAEIDEEIRVRIAGEEYALAHESEVPAEFKDRVAEYFKALSEAAASDN